MQIKEGLLKFWKFLKSDSWLSLIVTLIIAALLILYVFFPILQWATGSALPLVIVESCSMYHDNIGFEEITARSFYDVNNIDLEETRDWDFQRGLNKGDIIFVVGPKNIKKGDVIIFNGGSAHPIIHRLVDGVEPYATLGDNNPGQLNSEKSILQEQILGKAVFRIRYLGWVKLIFFDLGKQDSGFCSSN